MTCKLTDFRNDNPPFCTCKTGYYENKSLDCIKCPDNCEYCGVEDGESSPKCGKC